MVVLALALCTPIVMLLLLLGMDAFDSLLFPAEDEPAEDPRP
ncbi:hypothetical protein AB0F77_34655 [Streptomyces sp. NPDC026672]